jgi:hypothetical protein
MVHSSYREEELSKAQLKRVESLRRWVERDLLKKMPKRLQRAQMDDSKATCLPKPRREKQRNTQLDRRPS